MNRHMNNAQRATQAGRHHTADARRMAHRSPRHTNNAERVAIGVGAGA